jgi:hypothetical protein
MVIAGTLNEPGTVTISGKPATVDAMTLAQKRDSRR